MSIIPDSFVLAPDSDWITDFKQELDQIEQERDNKRPQQVVALKLKRIRRPGISSKKFGHLAKRISGLRPGNTGPLSGTERERSLDKRSKRKKASY